LRQAVAMLARQQSRTAATANAALSSSAASFEHTPVFATSYSSSTSTLASGPVPTTSPPSFLPPTNQELIVLEEGLKQQIRANGGRDTFPWKKITQWMSVHGSSYDFAYAPAKAKWYELLGLALPGRRGEKLCGKKRDEPRSDRAYPQDQGLLELNNWD
jgi:hypothetical protein